MARTYQRYPKMRYHKTLAPQGRTVLNTQQDVALGEGWVNSPAAFEPGYVEPPEPEDGALIHDPRPPDKEYIPYPAMRYARNGETTTVYNQAQDEALDPFVWRNTPDPAAWADVPPPAPPDPAKAAATAAAAIGESLYFLNATESTALVNGADTPEKLDAIETAEKAHPKHEGGRVSVLRAIEERRAALMAVPA